MHKYNIEKLEEIEGFGEKIAKEIIHWFNESKNIDFLKKLGHVGMEIERETASTSQKLSGKHFVVTGTLSGMSREDAKAKIREAGGKIQSAVSAKTDYVVCGKNPGSKYDKAKKLNIPLLDEEKFLKMLDKL